MDFYQYFIKLGKNSAIFGNRKTTKSPIMSHTIKTKAPWYISLMEVPFGATPCITKSVRPKGGLFMATPILSKVRITNHRALMSRDFTIGIKMGSVTISIETCSIKQPKIKNKTCMMTTVSIGERL